MLSFIKTFAAEECGAVTVDWVVLTAATMILGTLVLSQVQIGAKGMADGVQASLETDVPPLDFNMASD